MRSTRRRTWRHLTPVVAAALGVSGLGVAGLVAAPGGALPPPASLSLSVSTPEAGAAANTLYAGQPATYQLTVTAGTSALSAVTVTDAGVPADFTVVSGPCTTGGGLSCTVGNVAANTSVTVTATLQVPAAPAENVVNFAPSDTADSLSTGDASVAILGAADLSLTKTLTPPYAASTTPPYKAGTAVTYTLTVSNAGPDLATAPVVTDTLPAGLTFTNATVGSGPGGACDSSALPTLTCHSADLDAPAATALDGSQAGMTLPQPTINVVSTAGFPAGGAILVSDSAAQPELVTCTGTTPTSFTGCSGGTGTLGNGAVTAPSTQTFTVSATIATAGTRVTTGAAVASAVFDGDLSNNAAVPPQGASVPYGTAADPGPCSLNGGTRECDLVAGPGVINPFPSASTPTTTISGAVSLPQATLNVVSTAGFPPYGTLYVATNASPLPQVVTCTATTPTSFTGCTGGTGTTTGAVSTLYTNIPVWGFAMDTGQTVDTVDGTKNPFITIPGPTLVANEGETLDLVVRNELPTYSGDVNNLAVQIPGMTSLHPDDTGIASGLSTTSLPAAGSDSYGKPSQGSYEWALNTPGTYIYEAGQTSNGSRQLAMGLSGLLVVRPKGFTPGAAGQALFDPCAGCPAYAAPLAPHAAGPHTGSSTTTSGPTTTTTTAAPAPTTTGAPGTTTTAAPDTTTTAAPAPTTTAAPAPTTTAATADATTTTAAADTTTAAPTTTSAPTTTAAPAPATTTTSVRPSGPAPKAIAPVQHGAPAHAAPVVAPAPGTACASPDTSSGFTAEALVQVEELSAEFHAMPWTSLLTPGGGNGAVPATSQDPSNPGGSADVANYAPDVFLINGQSYPNTQAVDVAPTDCLVLHYANLGMLEKSLGVAGQRETVMADDSVQSAHPQDVSTRYLNPGEEFDAVVNMNDAPNGSQFPIMDFEHHLNNGPGGANAAGAGATGMTLGGQLEVIQVTGSDPAATNPVIDSLQWASACPPGSYSTQQTIAAGGGLGGLSPMKVNVNVHGNGPAPIASAEWSVDSIVPAGSGTPIAAGCNTILSSALVVAPFANGDHTLWVRVKDQNGNWSDPAGVVFTYDDVANSGGPALTNFSLSPSATNSTATTPNKYVAAPAGPGAICPTNKHVDGVPDVSCDVVIDGTATPSLADWTITGVNYSISHGATVDVPYAVNATPLAGCASVTDPTGCSAGAGGAAEVLDPISQATVAGLASDVVYTVNVEVTEVGPNGDTRTSNPVPLSLTKVGTGPVTNYNPFGTPGTQIDPPTNIPYAGPSTDNSANLNYFTMVRFDGAFSDPGKVPAQNAPMITGGEMAFAPECPSSGYYKGKPCTPGSAIGVLALNGHWTAIDLNNPQPVPDGTGIPVTPSDGLWNNPPGTPVNWNVSIPTIDFNGFPQGHFWVFVHGKDQSGTWGAWNGHEEVLDKTAPTRVSDLASATDTGTGCGNGGDPCLKVVATDLPGNAVPCISPGVNIPNGCGGDPASSTIRTINWYIVTGAEAPEGAGSWYTSVPGTATDNQTVSVDLTPANTAGEAIAPGDQVSYRIIDGAGNSTDWITTTVQP